jgi:hypothetical protein
MQHKICITTDRHISLNPRVWKEAKTLSEKGYSVSIVTQFITSRNLQRDERLLNDLGSKENYMAAVSLVKGE